MVAHMVHTPTTQHMAKVVALALEQSDISVRQASEMTAIARTTLTRKMRTGDFTVAELDAIAEALGTTVADLFAQADEKAAS